MKFEQITKCSCGSTQFSVDDSLLQSKGLCYKVCNVCGKRHLADVYKDRCFHCRKEYNAVSWFLPSGCSFCHKTFVD